MKKETKKEILFILGWVFFGGAAGSLIGSGFEPPYTVARDFAALGLIFLLVAWRLRA